MGCAEENTGRAYTPSGRANVATALVESGRLMVASSKGQPQDYCCRHANLEPEEKHKPGLEKGLVAFLPPFGRPMENYMRINLTVPYAERNRAKKHGARWDIARRVWYVENLENLTPFLRWMPKHLTHAHGKKTPEMREKIRLANERRAKERVSENH